MIQALLSGVASIKAQSTAISQISNNLANINTTSYKSNTVSFEDAISQTLRGSTAPTSTLGGTNATQLGLGVNVGGTSVNEGQGSLNSTNVPSDLALQGNGYFMVSNGSQPLYTRDGTFSLDATGTLVNSSGDKLLGWTANSAGKIDTTQAVTPSSVLTIPLGASAAAQATSNLQLNGNLNASAASTDTWNTQATVYDSQGNASTVTIQFTGHSSPPATTPTPPAGATSSWTWSAYAGSSTTGTPLATSSSTGNSLLYFDANGQSVSGLAAGASNTFTVPGLNGSSPTKINLSTSSIGQLGTGSSVAVSDNDGFAPGNLQSYNIGGNGVITGTYSNGITRSLGQVSVATFSNAQGLSSVGNNTYATSSNSGNAVVGVAGSQDVGTINSGYLEQSNVDISSEFSNLIITQRGYEANTKIVSTVDTMLQDVIDMKH